jgi:tetratricopeptide (TPR) repeat protein
LSLPVDKEELQNENIPLTVREKALIHIVLGLSYFNVDNYDEAMNQFQKADDLEKWYDHQGKAVLYVLMGGTLQSTATQIRNNTSELYWSRLEEAESYFSKAQAIDKQYARPQLGLANILYLEALGDPFIEANHIDPIKMELAEQAYKAVQDLPEIPENANVLPKTYYGLGQVYLAEGHFDLAEGEFLRIIDDFQRGNENLENLASHAYARVGWIARKEGDYPQAINFIDNAIDHASPYYRVRYHVLLGDTYWEMGETEQACKVFSKAKLWAENIGDLQTVEDLTQRCSP